MLLEGIMRHDQGDYIKEFEYYTKATELGDVEAHYKLACMYNYEHGVEKDMGKIICHLEEAILGGIPLLDTILEFLNFKLAIVREQ
jgi:TPR repeat protein